MKPILITTPRTGSNIIVSWLYDIAREYWGYKNVLYEYWTVIPEYRNVYSRVNDTVEITDYQRVNRRWFNSVDEIQQSRLELLANEQCYMIKIMTLELTPLVREFCRHYDKIYLERRRKLDQIYSYMGVLATNITHYTADSQSKPTLLYNREKVFNLLKLINVFYDYRRDNPGNTVYYEDFISNGANATALNRLLDLRLPDTTRLDNQVKSSVPTPYNCDPESLIINYADWKRDRTSIVAAINQIGS